MSPGATTPVGRQTPDDQRQARDHGSLTGTNSVTIHAEAWNAARTGAKILRTRLDAAPETGAKLWDLLQRRLSRQGPYCRASKLRVNPGSTLDAMRRSEALAVSRGAHQS